MTATIYKPDSVISPHPRVTRLLGQNPSPFTGAGTNTWLAGEKTPVLIDTGSGYASYTALLDESLSSRGEERPSQCLLTHGHPDHSGGVAVLARRFPGLAFRKMPWVKVDEKIEIPFQPMADGDRIEVEGGLTLRAVHTPGHSPDHLCFLWEEEHILFTGDLVLGAGTTFIPRETGNMGEYMASLEQVLRLNPRRIFPGHGPVIESPQPAVEQLLNHRREREAQILACIAKSTHTPPTVENIATEVYKGYSPALGPLIMETVGAHVDKLLAEGRVFALPEGPPRYHI
ncbi:MAG: beta-lactamase-like protein 2 [Deltaproteobacteria bacterium]|nr:beta-lactamase-like protein 2 [Deltaproteobacteria bacterium]